MADDTQQLLFAKQLADNAKFANEAGLRNLLQIIETGSEEVVSGSSYFPGAFDAWKQLVAKRPDLFSDAITRELEKRVEPPKAQRITVGRCDKCNRELRVKASGVRTGMRLTCKCGHVNVVGEKGRLAAIQQSQSTSGQGYGQQAAAYALKFLQRDTVREKKSQHLPSPPMSVTKRFLDWLRWLWIPGISGKSAPTRERGIIMTDNEMLQTLERLCRAYASHNTIQVDSLEPIATKIGEELDRRGGITEMRRIFNLIDSQQRKRTLEMHWNGIGEWQG